MWDDFKRWAGTPYSDDMSALHWFFFIGLLIAISAAWGMILRAMK